MEHDEVLASRRQVRDPRQTWHQKKLGRMLVTCCIRHTFCHLSVFIRSSAVTVIPSIHTSSAQHGCIHLDKWTF